MVLQECHAALQARPGLRCDGARCPGAHPVTPLRHGRSAGCAPSSTPGHRRWQLLTMLSSCHSASRTTKATSARPSASPCSCSMSCTWWFGCAPASVKAFCSDCSRPSTKAAGHLCPAPPLFRLGTVPLLKSLHQRSRHGVDVLARGQRLAAVQGPVPPAARAAHMGHQIGRKLAMVQSQRQRELLRRHVDRFFIKRRHHFGQYEGAAQRRNLRPGSTHAGTPVPSMRSWCSSTASSTARLYTWGIAHHQHGGDGWQPNVCARYRSPCSAGRAMPAPYGAPHRHAMGRRQPAAHSHASPMPF